MLDLKQKSNSTQLAEISLDDLYPVEVPGLGKDLVKGYRVESVDQAKDLVKGLVDLAMAPSVNSWLYKQVQDTPVVLIKGINLRIEELLAMGLDEADYYSGSRKDYPPRYRGFPMLPHTDLPLAGPLSPHMMALYRSVEGDLSNAAYTMEATYHYGLGGFSVGLFKDFVSWLMTILDEDWVLVEGGSIVSAYSAGDLARATGVMSRYLGRVTLAMKGSELDDDLVVGLNTYLVESLRSLFGQVMMLWYEPGDLALINDYGFHGRVTLPLSEFGSYSTANNSYYGIDGGGFFRTDSKNEVAAAGSIYRLHFTKPFVF